MIFSRATVLLWLSATLTFWYVNAAYPGDKTTYTTQGESTMVRRERNVDHWDSDTLAFYLDEYPGYDLAIMFYAQWDRNSHALAPYWDRIATVLDAGNSQSRLIMALFDCELNVAHTQLCNALSVTAYPTVMFVGSGPYHDTDPVTKTLFGAKSAGIMGESPVSNTVKFQGNWQYTDAILDWLRSMQALSNWHMWTTVGFGRRLRNVLVPHKTPITALPVGIPGDKGGSTGTGSSSSAAAPSTSNAADIKVLEQTVEYLTDSAKQLEKYALRSSTMLDNLLVPGSNRDMFGLLDQTKAWQKETPPSDSKEILRNCVVEISLDYCHRVNTKVANALVDELEAAGTTMEEMLAMDNLEQIVLDGVAKEEPYCLILEECILSEFEEEFCRPKTCPFANEVACRYLTSCLDPELQNEYAEALGFSLEEAPITATSTTEPEAAPEAETKRKTWGF